VKTIEAFITIAVEDAEVLITIMVDEDLEEEEVVVILVNDVNELYSKGPLLRLEQFKTLDLQVYLKREFLHEFEIIFFKFNNSHFIPLIVILKKKASDLLS